MASLSIGEPYFEWDDSRKRWRLYFPYTASGMNPKHKYYILPGTIRDNELKAKGSWGLPYKESWSSEGYVVWDKVKDLDTLYFLLWNTTVGGWDPFYTDDEAAEALTSKYIGGLFPPTPPCGACETECQTGCMVSCEEACKVECQETCKVECQTGCMVSCEEWCKIHCQDICETTCETACETACEVECQTILETLGCPVAVVANGTELVDALGPIREFRDTVLKKYAIGCHFIKLYYNQLTEWLSPFLAKHDLPRRLGQIFIRGVLWCLRRKYPKKE